MQKKFLMYLLLFGILLKFSTAKVTALSQNENTLVPIESTKISEIVTTYKVDNGNYFISEFNLNDCSPGDEIILYNENENFPPVLKKRVRALFGTPIFFPRCGMLKLHDGREKFSFRQRTIRLRRRSCAIGSSSRIHTAGQLALQPFRRPVL